MSSTLVVTSEDPPAHPTRKKRARVSIPNQPVTLDDFCILATPHPYGILPSGNRFFDKTDNESNTVNTRLPTRLLTDTCWYTVLEFCDGPELARLTQTCRYFYACGSEPELWRDLVLREKSKAINYAGSSWKDCYVAIVKSNSANCVPHHRPLSVKGVYSDYFHRLHACRSFPIPRQWLEENVTDQHGVARIAHDELSIQRFEQGFEQRNLPLVVQGAAKHWRAFEKWKDPLYLLDKVGDRTFRATSGAAPLPGNFTLKAYRDYCHYPVLEEAPLYLFDRSALHPGSHLWKDYMPDLQQTCPYWDPERKDTTHDLFKLLGEGRRPDHTWLIMGPRRSGSVFHLDPNATHAWNATIVGRKRWIFYPPGVTPPGVLPSADGDEVALPLSIGEWLFQFWNEHVARLQTAPEGEKPMEFTAFPGDVVFVPHGWWHMVINLDDMNIAITHNYVSGSNLSSVLKFTKELNDQVSGCRDRDESIKPEHLRDEFVKELQKSFPALVEKALADNSWGCNAWKSNSTEEPSRNMTKTVPTSVMAKAKDSETTFSFSFM